MELCALLCACAALVACERNAVLWIASERARRRHDAWLALYAHTRDGRCYEPY